MNVQIYWRELITIAIFLLSLGGVANNIFLYRDIVERFKRVDKRFDRLEANLEEINKKLNIVWRYK